MKFLVGRINCRVYLEGVHHAKINSGVLACAVSIIATARSRGTAKTSGSGSRDVRKPAQEQTLRARPKLG
jgi:hypothetical protein